MERPTETVVETARSAAEKLTGWKRRQFEAEIESLVEPESQADPKFQTTLAYTRITAESVHAQLLELPLDSEVLAHVPTPCTIRNVLNRTQFMKRLVAFSDQHRLTLQLAYYPPYHSKYNPIERCWGILENHWNGTLLTSGEAALSWARTMTWRGVHPVVHFTQQVYETGVRIAKATINPLPNACSVT